MTKNQFLQELATALKHLTKAERFEVLQDYQEHFDSGLAAGKTESEIINSLGSPRQIATEILADYPVNSMDIENGTFKLRTVFMLIMVGFFNLVFVLAPAIVLIGFLFAGWLIAAIFFISPILVIGNLVFGVFSWFEFFISLVLSSSGYFLSLGMGPITKLTIKIVNRYITWNLNLIRGGSE